MRTNSAKDARGTMPFKRKLVYWVKTARVQTAMVTSLALWVGYIATSDVSVVGIVSLAIIGILVHVWGFTLNEIKDSDYDSQADDVGGHPIAQGFVDVEDATKVAWLSAFTSVIVLWMWSRSPGAVSLLLLSFVPGYMYNEWSKVHWWSNGYLSMWAALLVFTGSAVSGTINVYSVCLAFILSIQIFVQVIQGDLKDLKEPESSFAAKLGVITTEVKGSVYEYVDGEVGDEIQSKGYCEVVRYPFKFSLTVYSLKIVEAGLLAYVSLAAINELPYSTITTRGFNTLYITIFILITMLFIATASLFLVYIYDRDEIKKKSALHEVSSIILIGMSILPLSMLGGVIVATVPAIWFIGVNTVIHSSSMNPDI